jgi:hypothetical protein
MRANTKAVLRWATAKAEKTTGPQKYSILFTGLGDIERAQEALSTLPYRIDASMVRAGNYYRLNMLIYGKRCPFNV